MNKLIRSYTRKTERKHESSGGGSIPGSQAAQQQYNTSSSGCGTSPYGKPVPVSVRNESVAGSGSHQYNQKQQRHHESHQQHQSGGYSDNHRNGYQHHQVVPTVDPRYYDTAWSQKQQMEAAQRQGFSESSTYETKEHYEKKVQRTKKNRNDSHSRIRLNGAISNGSLADKRVSKKSSI